MWGGEVWRAVVWWSLDNSTNFKNKWGFLPIVCEANQEKMKISRLDYTKPVLLPKELLSFGCCFVALALSYPCYSTWSGSILRLDKQFAAWSIILERLVLHSLVLVFVYTKSLRFFRCSFRMTYNNQSQIRPGLHAPRDFAIGNDLWSPYPSSCAKKWLSLVHCDSSWFISVHALWVFRSSSLPLSSNLAQERCCVRLWKCRKNYPLVPLVKCLWDRASDSNFPYARFIFMKSRHCIPGLTDL